MAYVEPTPADLRQRYSAFAAVDDATIAYWLTDAHRYVDQSWPDTEYQPGLIAAAAHFMARGKVAGLVVDQATSAIASGLTSWKSGSAALQFSEAAASRAAEGGWSSTSYGEDYLAALARKGPAFGVTGPGCVPCGYGAFPGLPYGGC